METHEDEDELRAAAAGGLRSDALLYGIPDDKLSPSYRGIFTDCLHWLQRMAIAIVTSSVRTCCFWFEIYKLRSMHEFLCFHARKQLLL